MVVYSPYPDPIAMLSRTSAEVTRNMESAKTTCGTSHLTILTQCTIRLVGRHVGNHRLGSISLAHCKHPTQNHHPTPCPNPRPIKYITGPYPLKVPPPLTILTLEYPTQAYLPANVVNPSSPVKQRPGHPAHPPRSITPKKKTPYSPYEI
jgi:hypothetical protein